MEHVWYLVAQSVSTYMFYIRALIIFIMLQLVH